MKLFSLTVSLYLGLAVTSSAQAPPGSQPFARLAQFLGLSNVQVNSIARNNEAYNQLSRQKLQRVTQVRQEIERWTAAQPIDPEKLGVRYAEIEAICRELRDEARRYQQSNRRVLNEQQQGKLNTLEEALNLFPTADEARSANLVGNLDYAPYGFNSVNRTTVSGGLSSPTFPGCQSPGFSLAGQ